MLVTDRRRCRSADLEGAVGSAVAAGIDAVQLREKDLEVDDLYELALSLRRLIDRRCAFIVNGRLDVALAVAADGVHLPERGLPLEAARRVCPNGFLIGRSVHSVAGALQAETGGASYVQLGTIYETASKPGLDPAGPGLVRAATSRLRIPCLAVGGVDADNAGEVLASGAAGIAVVSAILQAEDIAVAVQGLRRALSQRERLSPD